MNGIGNEEMIFLHESKRFRKKRAENNLYVHRPEHFSCFLECRKFFEKFRGVLTKQWLLPVNNGAGSRSQLPSVYALLHYTRIHQPSPGCPSLLFFWMNFWQGLAPSGCRRKIYKKMFESIKMRVPDGSRLRFQSHPSMEIISSAVFSSVENNPNILSVTGRLISIMTDSPSRRGRSRDGFNSLFSYLGFRKNGHLRFTTFIIMSVLV